MSERIAISIVTGFLGSGKTTLINELLPLKEMSNSAVLVNEFGKISIDSDLIESLDEDVMELSNGCVCCALNDDLAPMLVEFANKRKAANRPVDRVIIETTGMANAGPIIEVILEDKAVKEFYELDKVITTIDAINGETNLNFHAESVEQAALADRLLMTKLDKLAEGDQSETAKQLFARLRRLNPDATILTGDKKDVIDDKCNSSRYDRVGNFNEFVREKNIELAEDAMATAKKNGARHDHHISSFCLTSDTPKSLKGLKQFVRNLSEEAGLNLLRVKGLVNIEGKSDRPAVVQGVREVFDEPRWMDEWPNDDRSTRIVVIGWMLDQQRIQAMFECET